MGVFLLCSVGLNAQEQSESNPRLDALRNEKNASVLQKEIQKLEDGSVEDMELLIQYYGRDTAKKNPVIWKLVKKYPETQAAKMQRLSFFLNTDGPESMEAILRSLKIAVPAGNFDIEKTLVAGAYAEEPNTEKILEYLNAIDDPSFKVHSLLQIIEIIAGYDKAKALKFTAQEFGSAKKVKDLKEPSDPFKINGPSAYYDYVNAYGKLLFDNKQYDEAYKYTSEAYQNIKRKDAELIENYAFLSSLNGNYGESLPILSKSVKEGKLDQAYIEQVRNGFQKLNPGKDVDAYIESLKNEFKAKIRKDVTKLLVDKPAPEFFVTDVNGKKVGLADFKGKTIVLDFWATWCGPCVESFPAMQMAVNYFEKDPTVKFLFIHTWENKPDPLTDAKSFLAKRNHNFDLYIDPRVGTNKRSEAADAFKVDGIPAKFVIDPNGRIRFSVSGFHGKAEAAAEELVQMVEIARQGA